MKAFRAALCVLAFAGLAQARPIVVEETASLSPPDGSWKYFGRFGVAIDGDIALISGERIVDDPYDESGRRREGAAFLYQRSGASWNYTGQLGPVATISEVRVPGLAMKGGVAMTIIGDARVFERVGTTWTQAPYAAGEPPAVNGSDIEIDSGRILVPLDSCNVDSVVLRKVNGAWAIEGELRGQGNSCGESPPTPMQDIQGERAIIHNPQDPYVQPIDPARARQYLRNENGIGWREFSGFDSGSPGTILGPDVALAGPYLAITGNRDQGSSVAYEFQNLLYRWAWYGLQPVDSYLGPDPWSGTAIERVGSMFAQRDYSFDRKAYVVNVFRPNDDNARSSTQVATLQAKNGASVGNRLDTSGNHVIVNGWFPVSGGDNTVRVFELPANFEHPAVQVHDFESPSSAALWQPSAGSTFSIGKAATTSVYRQSSTAGTPASWLPTSTARNQAIQSEIIIRAVDGTDRWVGLTTRRRDDANYYYATLRTSGVVDLRRMVDGVITTLASAPASVTTAHRYRLRLESIGTVHRVYLGDRLVLTARDATLIEGTAGIIMNRARADYDNVIVTPSPFTTIYTRNFSTADPGSWNMPAGRWTSIGGVFRQSTSSDYGRAYVGARTDDQIVQVRVRPTSFAGPDNWVGVMARYQDERNHLYVSLRNRGVLSLWRRTNGAIQQLAGRKFTVATGTWYTVRVEIVNGLTRVFVNDQLQLSTNADPGPTNENVVDSKGQLGLITYKATADFDNFFAYQP